MIKKIPSKKSIISGYGEEENKNQEEKKAEQGGEQGAQARDRQNRPRYVGIRISSVQPEQKKKNMLEKFVQRKA